MPESGDSSRRAQKGGFRLFQSRRKSARSGNTSGRDARTGQDYEGRQRSLQDSALRPVPPREAKPSGRANTGRSGTAQGRGDVCQLGDEMSPAKKPERRTGWLGQWLNQGTSTKRGSQGQNTKANPKAKPNQPAQRATQPTLLEENRRAQAAGSAKQRRLQRKQVAANGTASKTMPVPATKLSKPRTETRSQERATGFTLAWKRRQRLDERSGTTANPARSPLAGETASVIPLSRKRNRAAARSRFGANSRLNETHLQTEQPTLLQQNTRLQSSTLLDENGSRSRKGRAPRMVPPQRATEPLIRPQSRSMAIALYAARMLILSIGVGVLAGTVLSAWNPANQAFWNDISKQTVKQANSSGSAPQPQANPEASKLTQTQELTTLKSGIQALTQQFPGFTPGAFILDLDTNNYVDWSGTASLAAASTIKVPVLIAFFQDVDAGKISLDEKLTMTKDVVAQGSGDMQYLPVGAQFSALETATKMITISDNTATNMLIVRLGGMEALNQRFQSWGLTTTKFNNLLPDLKGTNTTSAKELASLLVRVSQGDLVSLRSRDRLLDIMRRTVNNSQIPQGLGEGATIAHKTGDIGTLIGDVGLIDMPSGKRYVMAILVKREFNDDRAYDLIQKISRLVYQTLNAPNKPAPAVSPAPTTQLSPMPASEEETQGHSDDAPKTPEQIPSQPSPMQASTQ